MARVLVIKGTTGGLNSDKLDGKNCHYWPFPETDKAPPYGAVVEDKQVKIFGRDYAVLDKMHTLWPNERAIRTYFRPEAETTTWSEGGGRKLR